MMVDSPALDSVLVELGSNAKVAEHGGAAGIRSALTSAAKAVGQLRYYSQAKELNLTFSKLDIAKCIDRHSIALDEKKLSSQLNSQQPGACVRVNRDLMDAASAATSTATCNQQKPYFVNDFLLCRGHDLTTILGVALRSYCGSQKSLEATMENVESLLRVAYAPHFGTSELAASMRIWLEKHALSSFVSV